MIEAAKWFTFAAIACAALSLFPGRHQRFTSRAMWPVAGLVVACLVGASF